MPPEPLLRYHPRRPHFFEPPHLKSWIRARIIHTWFRLQVRHFPLHTTSHSTGAVLIFAWSFTNIFFLYSASRQLNGGRSYKGMQSLVMTSMTWMKGTSWVLWILLWLDLSIQNKNQRVFTLPSFCDSQGMSTSLRMIDYTTLSKCTNRWLGECALINMKQMYTYINCYALSLLRSKYK